MKDKPKYEIDDRLVLKGFRTWFVKGVATQGDTYIYFLQINNRYNTMTLNEKDLEDILLEKLQLPPDEIARTSDRNVS